MYDAAIESLGGLVLVVLPKVYERLHEVILRLVGHQIHDPVLDEDEPLRGLLRLATTLCRLALRALA